MEGRSAAHGVVEVVPAAGELEAGDGGLHGGLPRAADPSSAAAVVAQPGVVVGAPPHRDQPALHADARVRHGRHDPRERHPDRRRAAAHVAPGRSGQGHGGLAWRGERGGHEVAPGARLRLSRPERPGAARRHRPDRVLLPALLHPAAVQQRVVVPDSSARSRADPVRGLVAHPLPERPLARETHPTRAAGAGRPELADDSRTGLLEPAETAERPARQGVRVHAVVEPDRRTDLELRACHRRLPRRTAVRAAGARDPEAPTPPSTYPSPTSGFPERAPAW